MIFMLLQNTLLSVYTQGESKNKFDICDDSLSAMIKYCRDRNIINFSEKLLGIQ